MSFEHIDRQFIDTLVSSGIIDAYEYVLRKLIQDNLPRNQVYEKCARYLLEYQKLVLENNIRAKNAQSFYNLTNIEEEKNKEVKAKEIIPSYRISLTSKLLFEQEENKSPQKIFETNIDELMKNKLNLLSKNSLNEQMKINIKEYGSFASFVENENHNLRIHDFKIATKFTNFEFIPMEKIQKQNYSIEEVDNNNIKNNNDNLNTDTEFILPIKEERLNTQPSRKNTNKSKKSDKSKKSESNKSKRSETESISSKSVTPSLDAKIKKESKDIANDLMKK